MPWTQVGRRRVSAVLYVLIKPIAVGSRSEAGARQSASGFTASSRHSRERSAGLDGPSRRTELEAVGRPYGQVTVLEGKP
jgi:hypothetical protein